MKEDADARLSMPPLSTQMQQEQPANLEANNDDDGHTASQEQGAQSQPISEKRISGVGMVLNEPVSYALPLDEEEQESRNAAIKLNV